MMKKALLLSAALLLFLPLTSFSENLLANGGFSDGIKGWNGGNYSGGKGFVGAASEVSAGDTKHFAKLVKNEGPGGAQMMQQVRLPDDASNLEFSFRAKGCSANVYVGFFKSDGCTPFRDSLGNPAKVKIVFDGSPQWRKVESVLKVAPSARGGSGWVRVHFGILGGPVEKSLLIDDVSLVALKNTSQGAPSWI
jgi:hypothetical protein